MAGSTTRGGLVAHIWRNEGGGAFTDAGANLPGTDLGFVAWGDYDNDGDLDLLFGGNSNDGWLARIYRNDATNLDAASWSRIGSAPADLSGTILFTDTNTSFPQKFYRGVYPGQLQRLPPSNGGMFCWEKKRIKGAQTGSSHSRD